MHDDIERGAEYRHRSNRFSRTNQPLNQKADLIGLAGQIAFGTRILGHRTYVPQHKRTLGYQFRWQAWTIKVSTSDRPGRLFVKEGHVAARIYVLAGITKGTHPNDVYWCGWATGEDVAAAPVTIPTRKGSYIQPAHTIERDKLRDMADLCQIIGAQGEDAKALLQDRLERGQGEPDSSDVQGRLPEF